MRGLLVAALLLAGASVARGDSPADREARAHFLVAQKLFDAAQYDHALDEYAIAYRLTPYPALLYRIALCQDQLGRSAAALSSYQQYLAADPAAPRRPGIEQRIATLRTALAQAVAPPPVAYVYGTAQPTPRPRNPVLATLHRKWWLWTAVGAVAVLVVGLSVGLTAPKPFSPTQPDQGPGMANLALHF